MPRFVSICLSDLLAMFFFLSLFYSVFYNSYYREISMNKKMRTNWNLSIKSVATW